MMTGCTKWVLVAGLGLGLQACGDSGDSDGDSGPVNKAETKVVPASFTNTASSTADFNAKVDGVKTDAVEAPASGLQLSSTGSSLRPIAGLLNLEEDPGDGGTGYDIDFTSLTQALAAGADCSSQFASFNMGYEAMSGALDGMAESTSKLGEDFNTASVVDDSYDVQSLDTGGQFAFAYKMVPKGEGGFASFLPTLTYKGGATDNAAAFESVTELNFSAEGRSSVVNLATTFYADKAEMVAKFGTAVAVSFNDGQTAQTFSYNMETILTGGANPTLKMISNGAGGQAGGTFDMNFMVSKVAENSMKVELSGTVDGKAIDNAYTITKDATTCTVAAVE